MTWRNSRIFHFAAFLLGGFHFLFPDFRLFKERLDGYVLGFQLLTDVTVSQRS